MKRLITSASLAALGAASLEVANAQGLSSQANQKPWNLSGKLRGFYDDNYTTSPRGLEPESYGFEVAPSASFNLSNDQTSFGASYAYSMRYYDDRSNNRADHSHQANLKLSHAFSPNYKLDLNDQFVVAQEPEVLAPQGGVIIPLRTPGDNMRNTANAAFTGQIVPKLNGVVTYANNWFNYDEAGRSILLDRMEHVASFNLRYQILQPTVGVFGYQLGVVNYDNSDILPGTVVRADDRDNISHYAYVGVDHTFNPKLNASTRVGVQYTEYDRIISDTVNPYVEANGTWNYAQGSYVQLGVRHTRAQTDVVAPDLANPANVVVDTETTSIFGSFNHRITAKLVGSILAQFQNSTFEGGRADGLEDNFLIAGANLTYEINKNFSIETGYNFDRLDSDLPSIGIPRSYTRNRVYIGVAANF